MRAALLAALFALFAGAAVAATPVTICNPTNTSCVNVISGGLVMNIVSLNPGNVPINVSTNTTTQVVAAVGGKQIFVTEWDVIVAANDNLTWVAGTGVACGSSQVSLSGQYNFVAGAGLAVGDGFGAVIAAPVNDALCLTTSAVAQASGHVSYVQQ